MYAKTKTRLKFKHDFCFLSPAVEEFLTGCKTKKKFQQYGLKARRLEKSRSVKVENLPATCKDDFLELYFEKHIGTVERIKAMADERAAIVTFKDQWGKSPAF